MQLETGRAEIRPPHLLTREIEFAPGEAQIFLLPSPEELGQYDQDACFGFNHLPILNDHETGLKVSLSCLSRNKPRPETRWGGDGTWVMTFNTPEYLGLAVKVYDALSPENQKRWERFLQDQSQRMQRIKDAIPQIRLETPDIAFNTFQRTVASSVPEIILDYLNDRMTAYLHPQHEFSPSFLEVTQEALRFLGLMMIVNGTIVFIIFLGV